MSGGSYNYAYRHASDMASEIRERHPKDMPLLAFADFLDRIAIVMHDIEWADSGDYSWEVNPRVDRDVMASVRGILPTNAEAAVTVREARRLLIDITRCQASLEEYLKTARPS